MNGNTVIVRSTYEAMMVRCSNGGFRFQCSEDCCSYKYDSDCSDLSPIRKRSVSPEGRKGEQEVLPFERFRGTTKSYIKIAERNAQELINEEERVKNKAEKKKAKKQRQRKKKLMATVNQSATNKNDDNDNSNSVNSEMENLSLNSDNKEVEDFDVNAAFVSKVIKKVKNKPLLEEPKQKKEAKDLESIIKKCIHYESVDFKEAIKYLCEAISLAPKRIDLYLKRSLLYFKHAEFEKSVCDAQQVVMSLPNGPEGYYRLGEGHFALNNLSDAEMAFTKLINLNSHVSNANKRLMDIRIKQLQEMGYNHNQALTALLKSKNKTVEEAIEYLTNLESNNEIALESQNNTALDEDVYYSDEEEESTDDEDESADDEGAIGPALPSSNTSRINIVLPKNHPILTDPSNPFGCSSLFVGNLKKDITYQEISNIFIKFGDINSIKLTVEPNCYAFINYAESVSAGQAMAALQGSHWLLSTIQPLLIRFPHKVVNELIPTLKNPEFVLSKLKCIKQAKHSSPSARPIRNSYIGPVTSKPPPFRFKPHPVKEKETVVGEMFHNETATKFPVVEPTGHTQKKVECFFWRTTGCDYEDKCFNLHVPEHKGIAMK